MSPKKSASTPARRTTTKGSTLLSAEERAAMRETLKERKRASAGDVDGEADLLEKIAEMNEDDRVIAERVHAIVKESAPHLTSRTWYGMPAYSKDGNTLCYFQSAAKFKSRYATFGFNQWASLDDGDMWPIAFAVQRLTPAVEARIAKLVAQAAS